jgi:hypothetical protein
MQLEIIGAGLPRTGTMSLKIALEILGIGKCYHMIENFKNCHSLEWVDIYNEKNQIELFELIFKSYSATVDAPGCFFWKQLLELNPRAKVILTVRDDAEKWYESMKETIFMVSENQSLAFKVFCYFIPYMNGFLTLIKKLHEKLGNSTKKNSVIKFYHKYLSEIIEHCPKDKLLIYNVKQGWSPLCKFLNLKEPDLPFPFINDKKTFRGRIERMKKGGYLITAIGVWLFLTILYYILKCAVDFRFSY